MKLVVALLALVLPCAAFRIVRRSNITSNNTSPPSIFTFNQQLESTGLYGGGGGSRFDHFNWQGVSGAISKICIRSGWRVDQIRVSYGGRELTQGGRGGTDRGCFQMRKGEFITHVRVWADWWVEKIEFFSTDGITSRHFGPFGGTAGRLYDVRAPAGKHLMSLFGSSGNEMDSIGFRWGLGGGLGQWRLIDACVGCGGLKFKRKFCSERAGETSKTLTSEWSVSVENEMSAGFEYEGFGASAKRSISGSYSRGRVLAETNSFTDTSCLTLSRTCDKDYLWQWTFVSDFDRLGPVETGGKYACTNEPRPCCMPGTFSDHPRKCDLDPWAPNTCR